MDLTCLHFCTSEAWGGLELYACTLMVALKNAGCNVIAVCAPRSKIESFLRERNVHTVQLPNRSKVSPKSVRYIRSLIDEHRVKVLHVHFHKDIWNASLALRNDNSRKLFLSIYMGVTKKNDPLHRYIYRRVDAIFTSSPELTKRLPSLYPVSPDKIHFLPYGRFIDNYTRDEQKRATIRARYGVQPNEILVGTMVRIDPGKGAMDFVRSFSYFVESVRSGLKYLIVGEPTRKARARNAESPFEPHCEAYLHKIEAYVGAEKLGGSIFLAGFQEDLVGYLSAMDIFVFPSRDELYSLVVLDAMCMGLPVIAARAGGTMHQIQEGQNGLMYTVADSGDLARQIVGYLASPSMAAEHGKAAKMFVERTHSMKKTIGQLLEYYAGDRT